MKNLAILLVLFGLMLPQAVEGHQPCSDHFSGIWRPDNRGNGRLVKTRISKARVLVIAGKPDVEEKYINTSGNELVQVTEWSYIKSTAKAPDGSSAQVARLIFFNGELVCTAKG